MLMVMVMGMAMMMRVGMIMMMVMGVIMVVLMRLIIPLVAHGSPHPVVVVMDIPLMVIVVVNDQGARRALLMVLMVLMIVGVGMVVFIFMAGDPRLAASAYATHINLPRCR
ncbi:hypothetical protein [Aeromonas salmonicida]